MLQALLAELSAACPTGAVTFAEMGDKTQIASHPCC
jgi:hypothetical protein